MTNACEGIRVGKKKRKALTQREGEDEGDDHEDDVGCHGCRVASVLCVQLLGDAGVHVVVGRRRGAVLAEDFRLAGQPGQECRDAALAHRSLP